jgi:uncharacterized protein (DUF1778 family)
MKQHTELVPVDLEFTNDEFAAIEAAASAEGFSDPSDFIRSATRQTTDEFKASKR